MSEPIRATLAMDLPVNCETCPFFNDNWGYCRALGPNRGPVENAQIRYEKCPLKPLPARRGSTDQTGSTWISGFAAGYNQCLEDIGNDHS